MPETTSMEWKPDRGEYQGVECNPRVSDREMIFCERCGDEAVVVCNDGTKGLCNSCFDRYEARLRLESHLHD